MSGDAWYPIHDESVFSIWMLPCQYWNVIKWYWGWGGGGIIIHICFYSNRQFAKSQKWTTIRLTQYLCFVYYYIDADLMEFSIIFFLLSITVIFVMRRMWHFLDFIFFFSKKPIEIFHLTLKKKINVRQWKMSSIKCLSTKSKECEKFYYFKHLDDVIH